MTDDAISDFGSGAAHWPVIVIVISAGSLVCTGLLIFACTCCFKTKVPQYKAKLTPNVITRHQKSKFDPRRARMHSLIFEGAPIGSGRWDDLFVTGGGGISEKDKPDKVAVHHNPPDVIMHPALLRVLNKESRNITQGQAIIVPTNSVASPARTAQSAHPSTSLQELMKQNGDDSQGEQGTPLGEFPIRREKSQEFNRDGSIFYYKPKREATTKTPTHENRPHPSKSPLRDPAPSADPVTTRIEALKKQRQPRKSQRLPHFDRTSGEWDNVPKPRQRDVRPPIPDRKYLLGDSDVITDCSETMPRPTNSGNTKDAIIDINTDRPIGRQNASHVTKSPARSSDISRQSSPSSGATRMLPCSPVSKMKQRDHRNQSPISDTVFIPNVNPAYTHGSATPPGHSPRKDPTNRAQVRLEPHEDEMIGVLPDGTCEVLDETQRPTSRHKRVNEMIHDHQRRQSMKPGMYYRPKPYYRQRSSDKRYSDASDYSDMFNRNSEYLDDVPTGEDPYFFRSRWSSAFEPPGDSRQHRLSSMREPDFEAKRRNSRKQRHSRRWSSSSSSESPPDRPTRSSSKSTSSTSPKRSHRRKQAPLPELPYQHAQQHNPDTSQPIRNRQSRRSRRGQPPLEVVVEQKQHNDDLLVSPGHQPNYPVDVAKIRRGLQQSHPESKANDCEQSGQSALKIQHKPDQTGSNSSLHERASSDYGSLIDILYRYRQSVRKSRVNDKTPESRFKREKLKNKLKEELEPRNMQSRNVEMVVETLLYLCEAESSREKKRSWQRDIQSDTNARTARPSSYVGTSVMNENEDSGLINMSNSDLGNCDDYARIRSHSDTRNYLNDSQSKSPSRIKPTEHPSPAPRGTTDQQSANLEPADQDFAFPAVEDLNRMLGENAPPPVPPRRNRNPQSPDLPPPVTPRRVPNRQLPPLPMENPIENTQNSEYSQIPNGKITDIGNNSKRKNGGNEPDYAKIRKTRPSNQRKSLPSLHLTESELLWLQQTAGGEDNSYTPKSQGQKRRNKFQSTRVGNRAELPSPPVPPPKEKIDLDDIPVHETTDAEDIIKAVQRKMSEHQTPPHSNKAHTPRDAKTHSESETGTWSSVTSSEIPVTPRRTHLASETNRYRASESPVFLREHSQQNRGNKATNRHLNRAESLSPARNTQQVGTKRQNSPNILPKLVGNSVRYNSTSSVNITPPLTPPVLNTAVSPRRFRTQHSAIDSPISPTPTPSKRVPNFSRVSPRTVPKIPLVSRPLIQSTSTRDVVVSIDSDRRRISRTGEIVYLPEDNDYADPIDAITPSSPHHAMSQYPTPMFRLDNAPNSFYPIVEEGDYAVPVDYPPSPGLQRRIAHRSRENLMSDYESSV